MDTLTWTQPTITGSVCARYLHTSVVYEDKLFVYGGFAKSADCKSDVWRSVNFQNKDLLAMPAF